MAWIRQEEMGSITKVVSIIPAAMEAVQNMNRAITFGASALTRVQEECIATAVSAFNKCRY